MSERAVIAERLEEAGIGTERFIQCKRGSKASIDHTTLDADDVSGNYGIYATAGDALVILDIDDYGELDDKSGLLALAELAPTFEQVSPHGGTHRLYAVETEGDRQIAEVLADELGVPNPNPSWGEVRVANQYVVGAGSQLDGCDKDGCDKCETGEGGRYVIGEDRAISTIDAETLVETLRADPTYREDGEEDTDEQPTAPAPEADEDAILEYALEESKDEKLKRLFRGDYSDYSDDRSQAEAALAAKLGWWLQGDKNAVRLAMDRASTKKWAEREDDSYRESILEAVDQLDGYYTPSKRPSSAAASDTTVEDDDGEERSLPKPREFEVKDGGYGEWAEYQDDDGVPQYSWQEWTNFQIEVNSFLRIEGDVQIDLAVWPQTGNAYDVTVAPTVFNEVRDFKAEICAGLTTTFEGGQEELNALKRFVGTQEAPNRQGTHHMGLHGDEWVTPKGVLTGDGWADDPESVYVERSIGAERKWSLSPDDGATFDQDEVRSILELLPKTREKERLIPLLGWFYTAPLRPLIQDWAGQFNLMFVQGDTGSGKTTTISTLWEAFGMEGDPLTADDTKFTLITTLGSSNAVPMWFDEYKPSDMANYEVDRFWNEIRKTTLGGVAQRGNADKTTTEYHLQAPTIISGEERVAGAAEERRGIFTTFRKDSTDPGSETARAYADLVGGDIRDAGEIEYYDGYDLQQHALGYYRFILSQSEADLKAMWRAAAEQVSEHLADLEVALQEDLVEQGLQTVIFGMKLYEEFADSVGADTSIISNEDVLEAVGYVATRSQGGANRKSHLDSFFELSARAASHDYLEEGEHYAFVKEDQADEELRMNLATSYDKIARYAREHDVAEDLLNSKEDYYERIRDLVDDDESYVLKASQPTPGINRAVGLHLHQVSDHLNDFEKAMFTDVEEEDLTATTRLRNLDAGYDSVTIQVVSVDTDTPDGAPELSATLRDSSAVMDCISWADSFELEEDECYKLDDARIGHGPDGAIQIELVEGVTRVQSIQQGAGHTSQLQPDDSGQGQLDARADGGEHESLRGRLMDHFHQTEATHTVAALAGELDEDPEQIREAVERLSTKGELTPDSDGGFRLD